MKQKSLQQRSLPRRSVGSSASRDIRADNLTDLGVVYTRFNIEARNRRSWPAMAPTSTSTAPWAKSREIHPQRPRETPGSSAIGPHPRIPPPATQAILNAQPIMIYCNTGKNRRRPQWQSNTTLPTGAASRASRLYLQTKRTPIIVHLIAVASPQSLRRATLRRPQSGRGRLLADSSSRKTN